MEKKRVLIDTDMLGDDALAILFASRLEALEIIAITAVAGREPVGHVANNALKLCELMERPKIRVAAGAHGPLLRGPAGGCTLCQKCFDKLPKPKKLMLSEFAVDLIISEVMRFPGELIIITLGPLTNLALAIAREPQIVKNVKEVIVMGGAAFVPGNVAPRAEFNIFADPEAAKIVFGSGMPLLMVGLDVTTKTLMQQAHIDKIVAGGSRVGMFIAAIFNSCIDYQRTTRGFQGFPMHDPLTVGAVIDRSLLTTEKMYVGVEVCGELTCGETVADPRNTLGRECNMSVSVGVNANKFLDIFCDTIIEGFMPQ